MSKPIFLIAAVLAAVVVGVFVGRATAPDAALSGVTTACSTSSPIRSNPCAIRARPASVASPRPQTSG